MPVSSPQLFVKIGQLSKLMVPAPVVLFLMVRFGSLSAVVMAFLCAVQRAVVMVFVVRTVSRAVVVVGGIRAVGVVAAHTADKGNCGNGRRIGMFVFLVGLCVMVAFLCAVQRAVVVVFVVRTVSGAVMVVGGVRAVGIVAAHAADKGNCGNRRRIAVFIFMVGFCVMMAFLCAVQRAVVMVLVVHAVSRAVVVVGGIRAVGVVAAHAAHKGNCGGVTICG